MKIENQVCSLEQAKKLFDLGIQYMHDAQYMYVDYVTNSGHEFALSRPMLHGENAWLVVQSEVSEDVQSRLDECSLNAGGPIYPAFTVAELGVMLPTLGITTLKSNDGQDCDFFTCTCQYIAYSIKDNNEAKVKSRMLIDLLQAKIITAEECNERLK